MASESKPKLDQDQAAVKPWQLSIVIVGSDPERGFEMAKSLIAAAGNSWRIEVIIASARDFELDSVGDQNSALRISRPGASIPELRAAGLRAARSPWVALTEDFCAPSANWLDAILKTLESHPDVLAVGGPLRRETGRARDWALTLREYGRFMADRPANVDELPSVNVVFRREKLHQVLGEFPDELVESALWPQLKTAGASLVWSNDAVMWDRDQRPFFKALGQQFHHGKLYGGLHHLPKSFGLRAFNGFATPLLPGLFVLRCLKQGFACDRAATTLLALPAIIALSGAWALGEGLGTFFGIGNSASRWQG